jgi:4-hydroxy-3-methylbut-2-enyl diphosphate reductase
VESPGDVSKLAVKAPDSLAYVTQTTLSMDDTAAVIDALRARYPKIAGPRKADICYATQNRQDAVRQLAPDCDVFVVVGSPSSSNSNRLRELAQNLGPKAYLVDNADELEPAWFDGVQTVGLTAGASAPEVLVQDVLTRLKEWGGTQARARESKGKREQVVFSLPKGLAGAP